MRTARRGVLVVLMAAAPAFAQAPKEPAKDLGVHSAKVNNLEIRFVDYHWQPDIMLAMAKGAKDVPAGRRDWVMARVMVHWHELMIEGKKLWPGRNYALSLFPSDGTGMSIEFREVDMRDVLPNPNVMAPTPAGDTVYRGPAKFEMLDPPAHRLNITVTDEKGVGKDDKGSILLTINYGDRKLPVKLTR